MAFGIGYHPDVENSDTHRVRGVSLVQFTRTVTHECGRGAYLPTEFGDLLSVSRTPRSRGLIRYLWVKIPADSIKADKPHEVELPGGVELLEEEGAFTLYVETCPSGEERLWGILRRAAEALLAAI